MFSSICITDSCKHICNWIAHSHELFSSSSDGLFNVVTVKGPKGTLEKALPTEMEIKQEGDEVVVTRPNDKENEIFTWSYKNTDQ